MTSSGSSYPRPPVALIVTSQEWTALSVVTIFSPRGYATLRVLSGEQALQRMRDAPPDLIIVDRHLKDMTGTELAGRLSQAGSTTPLILLSTEPWSREQKLLALQAGAWDVCSLPMDAEELFLRVDTWVRSKLQGDVSAEQGLLDPDTGLYNLQGLLRRSAEIGAAATRHRRPMACVVVAAQIPIGADGNGEKLAASAAEAVAALLRETGRASDTIGRLSRTEFVVMAPDTDMDGVRGLAERLRRAAQDAAVMKPAFGVRFGCYAVPNMRDASIAPSELLIRAAQALRTDHGPGFEEPIQFFDQDYQRAN